MKQCSKKSIKSLFSTSLSLTPPAASEAKQCRFLILSKPLVHTAWGEERLKLSTDDNSVQIILIHAVSQQGVKNWKLTCLTVSGLFSSSDTVKKMQPYKGKRGVSRQTDWTSKHITVMVDKCPMSSNITWKLRNTNCTLQWDCPCSGWRWCDHTDHLTFHPPALVALH